MKSKNVQKDRSGPLRVTVFQFLLILMTATPVLAQESTMQVYPRFGIGVGFFHPSDVNEYIQTDLSNIGYINQYGTQDMFMYFDLQGALTFRFGNFDLSGELGYDIAPKLIVITNGENQSYIFRRISPGVGFNFYIPTGKGKHSFFAGAGAMASFMKFKEYTATAPGIRLQAGMSLMFGKFNMQPHLAFSYCKKSAVDHNYSVDPNFTLNFTGVQIGILLSAHPPVVRN